MFTVQVGSSAWASRPISQDALGDEYLSWMPLTAYTQRENTLASHHTRWPAGIVAEDGIVLASGTQDGIRSDVYSLAFDNLLSWLKYDGSQREGLTEVMAVAITQGNSLSVIAPTARYVSEMLASSSADPKAEALQHARSDARLFVERLASGHFGPVPEKFMIEIGSEYYATKTWESAVEAGAASEQLAEDFASVFAAIASEIKNTLLTLNDGGGNPNNVTIDVAVQMGRLQNSNGDPDEGGPADNGLFIDTIAEYGALDSIDALIWHRYNYDFAATDDYLFPGNEYSVTEAIASWESATGRDLALVVGWLTPDIAHGTNVPAQFYGAPSLTSILQQFSALIDVGMEVGTIFGTDTTPNQLSSLASGQTVFIGGQLYGLMAEALPGTRLLTTPGSDEGSGGIFDNTTQVLKSGTLVKNDTINAYAFEGKKEVVLFLLAKDFAGDTLSYRFGVDGRYSEASIVRLFYDGPTDQLSREQIGVTGTLTVPIAFETTRNLSSTNATVIFEHDYEVVRITFKKSIVGTDGADTLKAYDDGCEIFSYGGNDTLLSGAEADHFYGGPGVDTVSYELSSGNVCANINRSAANSGEAIGDTYSSIENLRGAAFKDILIGNIYNNSIFGGAGDDRLLGLNGDDKLFGGVGDDFLVGGKGNDSQRGGAGSDVFHFYGQFGTDTIFDFKRGAVDLDLIDLRDLEIDWADISIETYHGGTGTSLDVGSFGRINLSSVPFGEFDAIASILL